MRLTTLGDNGEILIAENYKALSRTAADEFSRQAIKAVSRKDSFTVALSGGSTPKGLYLLLGKESDSFRRILPWNRIHFFWCDDRYVPPDHPDSNFKMVYQSLLSKVPVLSQNIHRIKTEHPDPDKASQEYEYELRRFFQVKGERLPRFDLILLGMGQDGHTASIFPGNKVIFEKKRQVRACWIEKLNAYRVTLTPPLINNAACVMFLVRGRDKTETLRVVLQGKYQPHTYPAQIIHPTAGRLLWLVDREAARLLELNG